MEEQEKFQQDLIKYAEILNNYEQGNYKLSDEEFEFVKTLAKVKEENPNLTKEIDNIKNMARNDRKKYIENQKKLQEEKNSNKTTTEEIADTFDVDEKSIKEETLKDGKTLYVVYSNKLGRDIVLEDGVENESLTEELQSMKEEKLKDPESIAEDGYTDVIEDKAINKNLELSFVPINELNNYLSSIQTLTQEKMNELDCLVKNATSLGIEYINLENIVGLDKYGKIFEAYYDPTINGYKVSGTGDDIKENAKEEEKENLNNILNDDELDNMLDQNEEELDNDKQLVEEEHKQLRKEYTPPKPSNLIDEENEDI